MSDERKPALEVTCPSCGVGPGFQCQWANPAAPFGGPHGHFISSKVLHAARRALARERAPEAA